MLLVNRATEVMDVCSLLTRFCVSAPAGMRSSGRRDKAREDVRPRFEADAEDLVRVGGLVALAWARGREGR